MNLLRRDCMGTWKGVQQFMFNAFSRSFISFNRKQTRRTRGHFESFSLVPRGFFSFSGGKNGRRCEMEKHLPYRKRVSASSLGKMRFIIFVDFKLKEVKLFFTDSVSYHRS